MASPPSTEHTSSASPIPFRRLPAQPELPVGSPVLWGVGVDEFWNRAIAMSARNWMEDLHVAGAFSNGQAPVLNRAIRNRVHEVLMAWRRCNPTRPSNRFTTFLSGLVVDGDPEWPRSAITGAIARAIAEFAAGEGVDPATAAELEREATAGAQDAVDALLCFDERAKRQLGYLLGMVPAYWEPATISPEFRALAGPTLSFGTRTPPWGCGPGARSFLRPVSSSNRRQSDPERPSPVINSLAPASPVESTNDRLADPFCAVARFGAA